MEVPHAATRCRRSHRPHACPPREAAAADDECRGTSTTTSRGRTMPMPHLGSGAACRRRRSSRARVYGRTCCRALGGDPVDARAGPRRRARLGLAGPRPAARGPPAGPGATERDRRCERERDRCSRRAAARPADCLATRQSRAVSRPPGNRARSRAAEHYTPAPWPASRHRRSRRPLESDSPLFLHDARAQFEQALPHAGVSPMVEPSGSASPGAGPARERAAPPRRRLDRRSSPAPASSTTTVLGPTKGGVRYDPEVSLGECAALSDLDHLEVRAPPPALRRREGRRSAATRSALSREASSSG